MFTNTIPFEITREELWAVNKVFKYLWDGERKDFEDNKDTDHIFLSVEKVGDLARRATERFELHDRSVR